jgi:hypothetical protein
MTDMKEDSIATIGRLNKSIPFIVFPDNDFTFVALCHDENLCVVADASRLWESKEPVFIQYSEYAYRYVSFPDCPPANLSGKLYLRRCVMPRVEQKHRSPHPRSGRR